MLKSHPNDFEKRFDEYMRYDIGQLLTELSPITVAMYPGDILNVFAINVIRVLSRHPLPRDPRIFYGRLSPYLARIQYLVCRNWGYCSKAQNREPQSKEVVFELASFLASWVNTQATAMLLAVLVTKIGKEKFCGCSDP